MSGYRQDSFDPNAFEQQGRPLRPFNWVQWTGVGIASIGIALSTLHLAGWIGWTPHWVDDPSPPAFIWLLLGVVLINSRRQPATDLAPELASARKRWLIIIVGLCAVILGAAAAIELTGAN